MKVTREELDFTELYRVCSGGPGDESGGSGRARGRLLRPARGHDGQMGLHANLRGTEGVTSVYSNLILYLFTAEAPPPVLQAPGQQIVLVNK